MLRAASAFRNPLYLLAANYCVALYEMLVALYETTAAATNYSLH